MRDRHKDRPTSVRFPRGLKERLISFAASKCQPVNAVIVEAVEKHLEDSGATAAPSVRDEVPPRNRSDIPHRCPVKGWCSECQEMKGSKK